MNDLEFPFCDNTWRCEQKKGVTLPCKEALDRGEYCTGDKLYKMTLQREAAFVKEGQKCPDHNEKGYYMALTRLPLNLAALPLKCGSRIKDPQHHVVPLISP